MHNVVDKVKASMEQASTKTPFDTFMEEKVMNKPYLDKFQHLKEKKVRFSDDDYFNLLNKRNKDVILRKSNFVTVAGRDQQTADGRKQDHGLEVVHLSIFRLWVAAALLL